MMTTYQTQSDVDGEESTIEFVRDYVAGKVERMPEFSEFDYAIINPLGAVTHMIEVKNRKADAAKYPTIMLSMTKVIAASHWGNQGIRVMLLVRVGKGRPRWLDINATLPEMIGWGGRNGRGHDEPIAHFAKDDFEEILKREHA